MGDKNGKQKKIRIRSVQMGLDGISRNDSRQNKPLFVKIHLEFIRSMNTPLSMSSVLILSTLLLHMKSNTTKQLHHHMWTRETKQKEDVGRFKLRKRTVCLGCINLVSK